MSVTRLTDGMEEPGRSVVGGGAGSEQSGRGQQQLHGVSIGESVIKLRAIRKAATPMLYLLVWAQPWAGGTRTPCSAGSRQWTNSFAPPSGRSFWIARP